MPGLSLKLNNHEDKFVDGSRQIDFFENVNFIFGKNGTGKTTLADEIKQQLGENYSVHVFKDFENIAVNETLDSIALGTENASIQRQIDVIDDEIKVIRQDISKPEDDSKNLYTKVKSAEKNYYDQSRKIDTFYINSASEIKNISRPVAVSNPSYNKNDFEDEIKNAKVLNDKEIKGLVDTIKADKKAPITEIRYPIIDSEYYLKNTNALLSERVIQPTSIAELENNPQKQQFAKTGLEIHEHIEDELCAFCGNPISEKRWIILGNYFNDQVKDFEKSIKNMGAAIEAELEKIEAVALISDQVSYGEFNEPIKKLNDAIEIRKNDHKLFLNSLRSALDKKIDNLFESSDELDVKVNNDFSEVQTKYDTLLKEHNSFSDNLEEEQTKAKKALRQYEIYKRLDKFSYEEESKNLEGLKIIYEEAQSELEEKKDIVFAKETDRKNLISQTKNEEKIATQINELLDSVGFSSFSLKHVSGDEEGQKGQYMVTGHDGSKRSVKELSKGEKNIVALLYFLLSLDSPDKVTNKPRIVIFDDPMTSNDDTMQYLMVCEIQKLYRGIQGEDYFILLTHNCHFYLNVRPNPDRPAPFKKDGEEVSFYEKYGIFHLLSDGKRSTIKKITKSKDDFKTSYETLWKELIFLYQAPDATPDLMLNPCRKICETYMGFTKQGIESFYGENISAKKLFDVNQHSVDDFEAELNGKTKEEIKLILQSLFEQNNAKNHFASYWKEN